MEWANQPDNILKSQALNMWANYIETGDVNLSATDMEAMDKKVKALATCQYKLIVRLRELAEKENEST